MVRSYKTSEIAEIIGIHPNTVRLYEEWGFIPKPERQGNGYRIFTAFHLAQLRLARCALETELVKNGLRQKAIEMIKASATGDFERAEQLTKDYLSQIKQAQQRAEEAVHLVHQLLTGQPCEKDERQLTRKEAADVLQISMDTLRNWELNGLLTVKRKENGYRVYTNEDLQKLKIIHTLRLGNYSLSAILRLLDQLNLDPKTNIKKTLDSPGETEDIVSVCDKLLTSLEQAETNAKKTLAQLADMKKQFL